MATKHWYRSTLTLAIILGSSLFFVGCGGQDSATTAAAEEHPLTETQQRR